MRSLLLLTLALPTQGPTPVGIESRKQLNIQEMLHAGDGERLQELAQDFDYLFPRAMERSLVLRRLDGEDFDLSDMDGWSWPAPAAAALLRLDPSNRPLGQAAEESRVLELTNLRSQLGKNCDAELRLQVHRELAHGYHALGLPALGYEHELESVWALVDSAPPESVYEASRDLALKLQELPFPLAEAEARCLLGKALRAMNAIPQANPEFEFGLALVGHCEDSRLAMLAGDLYGWQFWSAGKTARADEEWAKAEGIALARKDWNRIARLARLRAQVNGILGRLDERDRGYRRAQDLALAHNLEARAASITLRFASVLIDESRSIEAKEELRKAGELLDGELSDWCGPDARMSLVLRARFLGYQIDYLKEFEGREALLSPELNEECQRLMASDLHFGDLLSLRKAYMRHLRDTGRELQALHMALALREEARGRMLHGIVSSLSSTIAAWQAEACEFESAIANYEASLNAWDQMRWLMNDLSPVLMVAVTRNIVKTSTKALHLAFEAWQALPIESSERQRIARIALAFASYGKGITARRQLGIGSGGFQGGLVEAFDLERVIVAHQGLLGPGEVLLAFDTDSAVAIATSPSESILYDLPDSETLQGWIELSEQKQRFPRGRGDYARHLSKLSTALLGPAGPLLEDCSRIYNLSDGPLARQALELLLDPNRIQEVDFQLEPIPQAWASWPYLFKTHEVVHVASIARDDREDRQPNSHPRALALLAYPLGPYGERLEGVDRETQEIAALYRSRSIPVSIRPRASESALRDLSSQTHSILHLASHVNGDPHASDLSWIQLAPDELHDGRATIDELTQLELDYDVIVLSGCSSARGPDGGTEGLLSVGWGCLVAKARNVVLSAAEVSDEATPHLMSALHRNLIEGHAPAEALRRARLDLIQQGDSLSLRAALLPFFVLRAAI